MIEPYKLRFTDPKNDYELAVNNDENINIKVDKYELLRKALRLLENKLEPFSPDYDINA